MLRALRIRNFAIIDDLSLSFGPGFTVLSGETGAGKSIIIDALGMLLGERASPDLVRTGQREAAVEAFFDPSDIPLFQDLALDAEEGIIARRVFSSQGQGKSRAFINDSAVSLSTLSSICRELITIYGQHEHHGLLKKETHLAFIDSQGDLGGFAEDLRGLWRRVGAIEKKVADMKTRARERAQLLDLYSFQIDEIDRAVLKPAEEESLARERAVLMNLTRLREDAEAAYALLYGAEGSCLEGLSRVAGLLRDIARVDQGASEASASLDALVTQLREIALNIRDMKNGYEGNPALLAELEERLELIKRLERKYGQGVAGILSFRDDAAEKARTLSQTEDDLKDLEVSLERDREAMVSMAEDLSQRRHAVAGDVGARIGSILEELGFKNARFEVAMQRHPDVTERGVDDVEFLFSANPGEALRPLAKIASGGELSRIMLALKSLEISVGVRHGGVGETTERTLIFDEVDAGIGGATAFHVGNKLKGIAGRYQALCITHLPQIAAMADRHLLVLKETHADHVEVKVNDLSGGRREEELARMLSGKITAHSLKHARELLTQGQVTTDMAATRGLFS